MTQTGNASTAGTVGMSDGTTRDARKLPDGRVEFWTFGNANSTRGHGWRRATAAQAATFTPDEPAAVEPAAVEPARANATESLAELADRIGHSEFCVQLTHETLTDAGYPGWDDAQARISDALSDGDVTCRCDDDDECPLPEVGTDGQQLPLHPAKRQFCRKGIHTCIPAVTLAFRNGAGRLHWCAEHAADAERYRPASDQAAPPPAPMIDRRIPELMSVTEVAALHEISRTAVQKMIDGGRLPAARAGRTWVVRRAVAEGLTVDGGVVNGEGAAA